MRCPECQREMARHGDYWFCGNHRPPISLPVVMSAPPALPLVEDLPTPLAIPLAEYLRETNPFIALHRLTDGAEIITRFFAIIALHDVHRQAGEFPASLRKELAAKLARPTFGAWRDLAAAALRILQDNRQPCFLTELPTIWREHWQPLVGKNEGDVNPSLELLKQG